MESTVSGRIGEESRIDRLPEDQSGTDIATLLAAALRDLDAVERDAVDQPSPALPIVNPVSEYAISVGGESIGGGAVAQPDNFRSAWRNRAKPVEAVGPVESVVPVVPVVPVEVPTTATATATATATVAAPAPQTPVDLSTLPPPPAAKLAPLTEQVLPVSAPLSWATPPQLWQPLAPATPAAGPFLQPPFGAVPQGPGFVPTYVPPFPQTKRKVWPWVVAGCTIPVLLLVVMVIGAVSLLGNKVEQSFATISNTLPAFEAPYETSSAELTVPQLGQCGLSPDGTFYFETVDCSLSHNASVVLTSSFAAGTLATDPSVTAYSAACMAGVDALKTSPQDTFVDLVYGSANGQAETHVCVLRQANVGGQFNTISNTLPG